MRCSVYRQISTATFCGILLCTAANASGEPAIPFVDGLWSGGVELGTAGSAPVECWANTVTTDGTTFTLAWTADGDWTLRMSNPDWQLPSSRHFNMSALVDFYPQQVDTKVEVTSATRMEVTRLEQISLLGLIENGHTIEFTSEILNAKYDLEGSAKAIQRIRTCFDDRS